MFNFTVLTIKDVTKYFIKILAIMTLIMIIIRNLPKFKNINLIACIDNTCNIIQNTNNSDTFQIKAYQGDFFDNILKYQIGSIEDYITIGQEETSTNAKKTDNAEKAEEVEEVVENKELVLAKTGAKTEVITPDPIELNYNVEYGNVKIKNGTSYDLTEDILQPNIEIDNKNILIFHTHTCESYTESEKYKYTPTGNFRTTDLNFTVARVGDELENYLTKYNFNVIHNKTYHDYPAYNGSYTRSLATVEEELKQNPSDIIFDIHRDAIGSRSDYAPTVKIGETDEAAQIMFVIGTDEGGLWHPNWQQNLKFAIKVQEKAEELYPGLFKPIMLTQYRYNQHAGKYASIIEVGATGNTLEQCLTSMKYLSKILNEICQ